MWPSAKAIAAASFAASKPIFATQRQPTATSPLSLASLFSFAAALLCSALPELDFSFPTSNAQSPVLIGIL
jgi:hypothetical protein